MDATRTFRDVFNVLNVNKTCACGRLNVKLTRKLIVAILFLLINQITSGGANRIPLELLEHNADRNNIFSHHKTDHLNLDYKQYIKPKSKLTGVKILYQVGTTDEDLPECDPHNVCNKIDLYDSPWLEKQCRCAGRHQPCSTSLHADDGRTLVDKTRLYKVCEPVKKSLPKCRYFRDATWTIVTTATNTTEQIVHCHCPKNSVTYLIKRQAYELPSGHLGYNYSFACSPQSRIRCQRKEPCRLFTVRKRQELLDEVNTNTLCQCPHNHHCPKHHTDPGVMPGKSYTEESIRTYTSYCVPKNSNEH